MGEEDDEEIDEKQLLAMADDQFHPEGADIDGEDIDLEDDEAEDITNRQKRSQEDDLDGNKVSDMIDQ